MTPVLCRICGCTGDTLKYVSDTKLLAKLKICLNISISSEDCLPKHICTQCEEGLEFSYRLRKRGEETEKRLKNEFVHEPTDGNETNGEDNEKNEQFVEYLEELKLDGVHTDIAKLKDPPRICDVILNAEDTVRREFDKLDDFDEYAIEDMDDCIYEDDDNLIEEVLEDDEEGEAEDLDQLDETPAGSEEFIEAVITPSEISVKSNKIREYTSVCLQQVIATYICQTCGGVLSSQAEYRKHIKEHGSERFSCVLCHKWFPTQSRLQKHALCHTSDVNSFQCPQCERSYRAHFNLLRHIRVVHEMQRQFQCKQCLETFGRADVLKNHMVRHLEEKTFECKQCNNRKFKSKRYLDSHMKIHQSNEDKKSLSKGKRPGTADNPSAKKSTASKKVFHCQHCGKISTHNFTHKNHLRTHTQERPFTCPTCHKSFRTAAALIAHERIHTDKRPYQCDICFSSFRQQSHLKEHRLIHGGVMPHKCSICEMGFTKKNNLRVHMRVHTGERPFKCTQCTQQFTRQAFLKRHSLAAHGTAAKADERAATEPTDSNKAPDCVRLRAPSVCEAMENANVGEFVEVVNDVLVQDDNTEAGEVQACKAPPYNTVSLDIDIGIDDAPSKDDTNNVLVDDSSTTSFCGLYAIDDVIMLT